MTGIIGHVRTALLGAVLVLGAPVWLGGADAVAAPPTAGARGETPVSGRAQVDVMVVYANDSGQVDPRLRGLQKQLEMMRFTGFRVLSTHDDTIGVNQTATFQIEGDRKIQVTLLSRDEENAQVRIQVFRNNEKTADTTMTIKRDRTAIFGIGKFQDGALILPITVSY